MSPSVRWCKKTPPASNNHLPTAYSPPVQNLHISSSPPAHHIQTTLSPYIHHTTYPQPTHWLSQFRDTYEWARIINQLRNVQICFLHLKIRLFKTIVLVFTLFIHIRNSYCLLIFFGITEKYHIKMTAYA